MSSFRGGSLVMWLQPLNHQRSWQCTLLQTTHMLKLYISSCGNLVFLKVKFSILCCDNTVHMVWLGAGAKTTSLKLSLGFTFHTLKHSVKLQSLVWQPFRL